MAYKRKTVDEYEIQIYSGPQYKWEMVTTEETLHAARQQRKCYYDNGQEPVRIVKKRVKIHKGENNNA